MNRQKVIVGQLGVGYWGPNLLRNFYNNPDCQLKTVVDISDERRLYVQNNYQDIIVSSSANDVFQDTEIDAITIATPAKTHFELAKKALKAGKHVLVEKPLALAVEEVDELGYIAAQNKLQCMVGHTFLYHPAIDCLNDIINQGELGQIRYIYSQRLNLGRIRKDVDALWNLAPHDISIVQYLLGDPTPLTVFKKGMSYVQHGIDDVVFLSITYPNNILFHIHVSWLDPVKTRKLVIVGSDKMVVFDDLSEYQVKIYDKGIDRFATLGENMDFDSKAQDKFTHRSGAVYIPKMKVYEPLKKEIEHFLDCIVNNIKCRSGIKHARNVIEILNVKREDKKTLEMVELTT